MAATIQKFKMHTTMKYPEWLSILECDAVVNTMKILSTHWVAAAKAWLLPLTTVC